MLFPPLGRKDWSELPEMAAKNKFCLGSGVAWKGLI